MNLTITHSHNFFKLKGILDKSSVSVFQNEFYDIFERIGALTISIEEIEGMDRHGVKAIASLHDEALLKHKKLSIIGVGCNKLYKYFKYKTTT